MATHYRAMPYTVKQERDGWDQTGRRTLTAYAAKASGADGVALDGVPAESAPAAWFRDCVSARKAPSGRPGVRFSVALPRSAFDRTAPCGARPVVANRNGAPGSLRASATIPRLRERPSRALTQSLNHAAGALSAGTPSSATPSAPDYSRFCSVSG